MARFTRQHLTTHVEIGGSLAAVDVVALRSLQIVARIRLLMQRLVRSMRRGVQRARCIHHARRVAADINVAVAANSWNEATWRNITGETLFGLVHDYGDIEQILNDQLTFLMTATRLRLEMQRFIRGLRPRALTTRRVGCADFFKF